MKRQFGSVIGSVAALAWMASSPCATPAHPRLFAPGTISSTVGADCATFMPDGKTVYFHLDPWSRGTLMVSHKIDGHWSTPQIASFSGRWHDHDPALAPDGTYMVFASNRPVSPGGKALAGGNLWRVNRVGGSWSAPVRLPDTVNFGKHVYAPSIAANGDLYFQSRDNPSQQFHIYRAAWRNGRYRKAVRVHLSGAGMHELDPAIAPDGAFIVFDAGQNGGKSSDHLYIAFRERDHWSKPVDLGKIIDAYQPWGAHLGPDGTTLYFTGSHTQKVSWPRTRAQAKHDLAQTRAWDNGTSHIWSVSLVPWLQAHRQAVHDGGKQP